MKTRKHIALSDITTSNEAVFNTNDYSDSSVMTFTATIADIYNAYISGYIVTDSAQRQTKGNTKERGGRYLATTLFVSAKTYQGRTAKAVNAASNFMGLSKKDIRKSMTAGGSISTFTFVLKKDSRKKVLGLNNKDSCHRCVYIDKIINNEIPLPKRVTEEFIGTNAFLEDFWSKQTKDTLYFNQFTKEMQDMFLTSPVMIQVFNTDDERFVRDIFQIKNDCVSVKTSESMNNSFTGIVHLFDYVQAFVGVVKNCKELMSKNEDVTNQVRAAIPAVKMNYFKRMFQTTSVTTMQSEMSKLLGFEQMESASDRPWAVDNCRSIFSQIYGRNFNLSKAEAMKLFKATCNMIYTAGNMIADDSELDQFFDRNLGTLNGLSYALRLDQINGLTVGISPNKVAKKAMANRSKYRKAYDEKFEKYKTARTTTYHQFNNARTIQSEIFGGVH